MKRENKNPEKIHPNIPPSPFHIFCKDCSAETSVGNTAKYPNGDLYVQFKAECIRFEIDGDLKGPLKKYAQYLKTYPELTDRIPNSNDNSLSRQVEITTVHKSIPRSEITDEVIESLVKTKPRKYQIEMYQRAMEEDIICCLPTGKVTDYHLFVFSPISVMIIDESI